MPGPTYGFYIKYQAKGIHKEALEAFTNAMDIDPGHVPSLVSTAVVLKQLGTQSLAVVRSGGMF
ncbi:hypothetical protein Sjap_006237 [Stephania japonica]|uniref:Uncharacterized protein n=1 Tax=Stephania japonica TaxID=461633 RepID=A0AAP0PKV3_9MAGN